MHTIVQTVSLRILHHSDHVPADGAALQQVHDAEKYPVSILNLRVMAMFVILVGGLLGAVPPISGRWMSSPDSITGRVIRSFSGGTILALALIHIIPEGLEQLSSLMEYPIGGIPVAAGLLMLVVLDYLATYMLAGRKLQQRTSSATAAATASKGAALPAAHQPGTSNLHTCCPVQAEGSSSSASAQVISSPSKSPDMEQGVVTTVVAAVAPAEAVGVAATGVSAFAHSHHHLPSCEITTIKHYVACYTMELGCIFHSVIIGVGIGVIVDAPRLLLTLTAVMVFHQALEGLALGSVLAVTKLSLPKKVCMCLVYALCMPVGIAIGIGVAESYDPESLTSLTVQGVLNGVSGGMLLYVSLFHFLGEETSKHDLLYRPRLAGLLIVAALLGVASMCVIGIWG